MSVALPVHVLPSSNKKFTEAPPRFLDGERVKDLRAGGHASVLISRRRRTKPERGASFFSPLIRVRSWFRPAESCEANLRASCSDFSRTRSCRPRENRGARTSAARPATTVDHCIRIRARRDACTVPRRMARHG